MTLKITKKYQKFHFFRIIYVALLIFIYSVIQYCFPLLGINKKESNCFVAEMSFGKNYDIKKKRKRKYNSIIKTIENKQQNPETIGESVNLRYFLFWNSSVTITLDF